MVGAKIIKQVMLERGITSKELAEKLGMKPQSLSNKFHRNSFTYSDVVKIADILNCDVELITRDTQKMFKE